MQVEVGTIVEGKVTGLTNFGAFVSLDANVTGMVHISEVSNTYVKDIREHLSEGQTVKVKVIGITPEGKISLSIKQAGDQGETEKPVKRTPQRGAPNVWQGKQPSSEPVTFEDMMAKFKQVSDDKISDLRRSGDSRFAHQNSRRGGKK